MSIEDVESSLARNNLAPIRDTEKIDNERRPSALIKSHETQEQRRRGRPKGSKNKEKNMLPAQVAEDMLGIVQPLLPASDYNELKRAIKEGKTVSTLKEVKIMMALMAPPIWMRLVQEAQGPQKTEDADELASELGPEPQQTVEFARDTNERVKVWAGLATLAANLEKQESDQATDTGSQPLVNLFKSKGLDAERFVITGRFGPGGMGGNSGEFGGAADSAGTIPNQLLEGPIDTEDSEEVEATRLFDPDFDRDDA